MTLEKTDCPLRQIIDDVMSVVQVRANEKGLRSGGGLRRFRFPRPSTPTPCACVRSSSIWWATRSSSPSAARSALPCAARAGADGRAQLQFAVSDTGIGIPADKIGELFQPFTQVDGSATRRYGGTGLGLAISRRLAKALGGDVEVASQLGKGAPSP